MTDRVEPASPEQTPGRTLDGLARALAGAMVAGDPASAATLRADLQIYLREHDFTHPREAWPVVSPADLPALPGVYVISSLTADEHYVGLALDLKYRFHNPIYGHLSPNRRSRARELLSSGRFVVQVPYLMQEDAVGFERRFELARREIEVYSTLLAQGAKLLNAPSSLGRVGETTSNAATLLDLETRSYSYAESALSASKFARSTAIFAVLAGYQRTAAGFVARWATPVEVEHFAEHLGPDGICREDLVGAALSSEPIAADLIGHGRGARLIWKSGALGDRAISELLKYRRRPYERNQPLTAFRGVSWDRRNRRWQCRAKSGPHAKDLWQVGRRSWSDIDAAVFREQQVIVRNWQSFNQGAYGSNASVLNALLREKRFAPW